MRLFIAIDLPEETKKELLRIQEKLPEAKIRPVKPEHMHLTLKFLGNISPAKTKIIEQELQKIYLKPFRANLSQTGYFSEDFIRIVWVGLEPEKEITKLQKDIDESLQQQFPKDKKFTPHITIARVKKIRNKEKFVDELKNIKVNRKEFEIKNFKLKKSVLTPEGPLHEDVAGFPDLQGTE